METIMGSIEVIDGDNSQGIPVQAATEAAVPTIVQAVFAVSNVVEVEAVPGSVACWDGKNEIGGPVRVILWPEAPLPSPRPQPNGEA